MTRGKSALIILRLAVASTLLLPSGISTSSARQLNALQEVDEFGDRIYLFGEAKRKFLQENLALLSQNENAPALLNSPQRAADSTRLA